MGAPAMGAPKRARRLTPSAARLTEIAAAAPPDERAAVFGPAARAARSGHRTRAYALLMGRDADFFAFPDFFSRRRAALAALFPPPPKGGPARAPPEKVEAAEDAGNDPILASLTPAQREARAALAAGARTAAEVAAALGVSTPAARSRLRTLLARGAVRHDDAGTWALPAEGAPAE